MATEPGREGISNSMINPQRHTTRQPLLIVVVQW
jgi:hypothetical protein